MTDERIIAQFRFMMGPMADEVLTEAVQTMGKKPSMEYILLLCIHKLNTRVKELEKLVDEADLPDHDDMI